MRTYTLRFDQAPFGRESIRLVRARGQGPLRSLSFSQTLTLDLRALGQEGFLTLHASMEYERGKAARSYRVESVLRKGSEYLTYPKSPGPGEQTVLSIDFSPPSSRMVWEAEGERREIPVSVPREAALVDPLSLVTWERLFLGETWKIGETRALELLLPEGPVRFDYHLEPFQREAPEPKVIRASLTVLDREAVEIFSVPVPSFRCRIPELGLTLWVSGSGGVLRYEDGRGLVALLEP